jgi:hypothetical protein
MSLVSETKSGNVQYTHTHTHTPFDFMVGSIHMGENIPRKEPHTFSELKSMNTLKEQTFLLFYIRNKTSRYWAAELWVIVSTRKTDGIWK